VLTDFLYPWAFMHLDCRTIIIFDGCFFIHPYRGRFPEYGGIFFSGQFLEENMSKLSSDFNFSQETQYILPAFAGKIGKKVPVFQQEALRKVAKYWDLEPLSGEIYAYSLGKDLPVAICAPYVSWVQIARQHEEFSGFQFIPSKDVKEYDINGLKISLPVWCKCVVKLTQNREVEFGVLTDEISTRDFSMSSSPREFLKYKAMVGAIRLALGVTGLCTPEEGRNLFETAQKEHGQTKTKDSLFRKIAVLLFG
jgi:hypothetical protein